MLTTGIIGARRSVRSAIAGCRSWYITPWIVCGLDIFTERSTLAMIVCTRASAIGRLLGPSSNIECPNASSRLPLGPTQVTVPLDAADESPRIITTETESPGPHLRGAALASSSLPPEPPRTGTKPTASVSIWVASLPSPAIVIGSASGSSDNPGSVSSGRRRGGSGED